MNGELLRLVDSIHRDKDIDKEIIFRGIEEALLSAARKRYGQRDSLMVTIDRQSGEILAFDGDEQISPTELGRIAAQTAKQVIIQKIKEAENEVILQEFETKIHDIINGTVQRIEGSTVIVNLGKVEGILPRREQIHDDTPRPGERIKCFVLDVRKEGQRVKIILSRTHPDIVRRLFEIEVPEVADRIIEIKGLAREPGCRTKIAVVSADSRVDCVGACVGVRGSRIKNIVAELGGEKIDIVPWNEQPEMFIAKALSPAEVYSITLNPALNRAKVVVPEDQLSLAIGKKGQNVRLASKLTHWDIDVMSKEESDRLAEETTRALSTIEGATEHTIGRLVRLGYTLHDLAQSSVEDLLQMRDLDEEEARLIVEGARRIVLEGLPSAAGEEEAEGPGEEAQAEEEAAEAQEAGTQPDEQTGEAAEEEPAAAASEAAAAAEETGEAAEAPGETEEAEEPAEQTQEATIEAEEPAADLETGTPAHSEADEPDAEVEETSGEADVQAAQTEGEEKV